MIEARKRGERVSSGAADHRLRQQRATTAISSKVAFPVLGWSMAGTEGSTPHPKAFWAAASWATGTQMAGRVIPGAAEVGEAEPTGVGRTNRGVGTWGRRRKAENEGRIVEVSRRSTEE